MIHPRSTLNPTASSLAPARTPRFGLGGMIGRVDTVMNFLEGDRTRQMLVEDFMGFGVFRTVMDLFRGFFFGDKDHTLNVPMAVERLIREVGSILTDNVSSGVAAFLLGKLLLDKKYKAYSNHFTSYPALEFFQDHLKNSPQEADFLANIAHTLGGKEKSQAVLPHLQAIWASGSAIPGKTQGKEAVKDWNEALVDRASEIAKALGKNDFDFAYTKDQTFALNELMTDLAEFRGALQKRLASSKQAWQAEAQDLVKKTLKAKNIKLSTCLWVGLGLTLLVPYAIRWFTHKMYHLSTYPGEIGLSRQKPMNLQNRPAFAASTSLPIRPTLPQTAYPPAMVQNFSAMSPSVTMPGLFTTPLQGAVQPESITPMPASVASTLPSPTVSSTTPAQHTPDAWEHFFPYLTRSARRGNFWPLVVSLLPLPFAAGLFDTVHRKIILPFSAKGFKQWRNLLDFGKRFPYTTQQQMAALFAFLIFSRLTSARSQNEFRERGVDSFLGWGFWILATPWLQKQASRVLGLFNKNSQLLKENGGIRTRLEIEKFLAGTAQKITRRNHILLGAVSTLTTIGLIGLLEPWLAIQWTKRNGASTL